jgi:uncharacterized membrane protein YoaK (UPF0700 family)
MPSLSPGARYNPSLIPNASVMPGMSMHLHSVLLSGVAGYVDAAGFASLIGLFPAHVTGEIVGDALALSSGHLQGHLTRLWVLPVFVGSVVLATLVARLRRRRGQRALTGLLALVTAALALFSASDTLTRLLHEGPHLAFLLGGACAVAAMGFQNSLMRESLAGSCPTTVMTGNLTHVVIEVVDQLFSKLMRPSKRDRKPRALGAVATALLAFVFCAALGGLLTRSMGSFSVVLPTGVTLVLLVRAWREDQRRLAMSALVGRITPALLPTFDVWPDSLAPRAPANAPLPVEPQAKPALPAAAPVEGERPAMKRTISGTQLSQRFRDGK